MGSKTLNTILSLQDKTSSKLVKVSSNFKGLSKEAQRVHFRHKNHLID
jgi:hypothetical protein